MENPGKYGEFIYTHTGDSLFVNLFIASRLEWKEEGLGLTQETQFPAEEGSRITVSLDAPKRFKMLVRHPGWVKTGEMQAICGETDYAKGSEASSYVCIDREWKNGDVIEIRTPMRVTLEEFPNLPEYVAILRGPIVLGARMGTENLDGLVADDSRWGHIASGPLVPVYDTPFLIGEREEILAKLKGMKPVEGKPLHYTIPGLFRSDKYKDLELEPFYGIHDSRYSIYWLSMDETGYERYQKERKAEEEARITLDLRTVDAIAPGEQQPEADHLMKSEKSTKGNSHGRSWRDARDGGYFCYVLSTEGKSGLTLRTTYWGNENGNREFDILIDGKTLATENLTGKWKKQTFIDVEYPIPADMLKGKKEVTLTFRPKPGNTAGGVFYIRLVE